LRLKPLRVGGNLKTPAKIRNVPPVYPPDAMANHVGGVVALEAIIDEGGLIAGVRILRSIPALDAAALDAVRQWQFTPTLLNGTPTAIIMTVTVNFSARRAACTLSTAREDRLRPAPRCRARRHDRPEEADPYSAHTRASWTITSTAFSRS
jgi:TonB family protein